MHTRPSTHLHMHEHTNTRQDDFPHVQPHAEAHAHAHTHKQAWRHKYPSHSCRDAQTWTQVCLDASPLCHSCTPLLTHTHTPRVTHLRPSTRAFPRSLPAHTCTPFHASVQDLLYTCSLPARGREGASAPQRSCCRPSPGVGPGDGPRGRLPGEIYGLKLTVWLGTVVRILPRKLNNSCPPF